MIHPSRDGSPPQISFPPARPASGSADRYAGDSPTPGAPYTYVTTKAFLLEFGLGTLRDLPDFEALEDAGLLSKEKLLSGNIPSRLMSLEPDEEDEEPNAEIIEDEMS